MYFKDRPDAGRKLADALVEKYANEDCVVLSLSAGGVIVGVQISMRLHCNLLLLLSSNINLPGEPEAIGALTDRTFTYDSKISKPELEDITSEFHGVIDQERLVKRHELNQLLSHDTKVMPNDLRDKIVIVVSDAFTDSLPLDVLEDFIKPIRVKKLVITAPLATVKALDKIHVLADDVNILHVKEHFISVEHHYENNKLPSHDQLIKIIKNTH